MGFDFDTAIQRSGVGNMVEEYKPEAVRAAGQPSYRGAQFDFRIAPVITEAVKRALDRGFFGFTIADDSFRERIVWWLARRRNAAAKPEWILPTQGTIFSLATSIRAFTRPGEGIVILKPGYMRYRQAADRLGRSTSMSPLIETADGYGIDFADLEARFSEKGNRIFVLCNPHNPIGRVWGGEDLERIARLAEKYGTLVYSDEIFAEVAFGDARAIPYFSVAGDGARCITCTSLGKSFGLAGINQANVIIPDDALRERFHLQRNADHYGSIDPLHRAMLMAAYSEEGEAWLDAMRAYVWDNYLYLDGMIGKHLPAVRVMRPEGTFVLWIDFRGLGLGSAELERFLFEEALFCLDPGAEYGGQQGFMRMNIAVPRHEIAGSLELLFAAARARGFSEGGGV